MNGVLGAALVLWYFIVSVGFEGWLLGSVLFASIMAGLVFFIWWQRQPKVKGLSCTKK